MKYTFSKWDTNLIKPSSIKMRQDTRLGNNENWDINISLWVFYLFMSYKTDEIIYKRWSYCLDVANVFSLTTLCLNSNYSVFRDTTYFGFFPYSLKNHFIHTVAYFDASFKLQQTKVNTLFIWCFGQHLIELETRKKINQ